MYVYVQCDVLTQTHNTQEKPHFLFLLITYSSGMAKSTSSGTLPSPMQQSITSPSSSSSVDSPSSPSGPPTSSRPSRNSIVGGQLHHQMASSTTVTTENSTTVQPALPAASKCGTSALTNTISSVTKASQQILNDNTRLLKR